MNGRNGGSILLSGSLKAGEKITYPILITWYFPNCHYEAGRIASQEAESDCCGDDDAPSWKPFYATQWTDAKEIATYVGENYAALKSRTQAFHKALFSSTLPSYVLDAISANLGILKSPTLLRQNNGDVWGWEGCFVDRGCCAGTCTHVWNYAQSLPHLFPNLERSFREQELERSMDRRGHVNFRGVLPEGPSDHNFHPAADGQLGGIMKVYREWQISGDRQWLKQRYPLAKRSLDYCIRIWDPKKQGVLIEPIATAAKSTNSSKKKVRNINMARAVFPMASSARGWPKSMALTHHKIAVAPAETSKPFLITTSTTT